MRVAFNDSFRMPFNLPRYASASEHQVPLNIVTFDALIRKLLFAFVSRCENSCNLLVQNLVLSSYFFTSPYWKHSENMFSQLCFIRSRQG